MKTTYKIILGIILSMFIWACDNDDDTAEQSVYTNDITINNVLTDTPNAYIIFDDAPGPFNDAFFIALTDGLLIEDTVNGISSTIDTSIAIALLVDNGGQVSTENLIDLNTTTYPLDKDDTVVVENITLFNDTFNIGTITYGELDEDSALSYRIENSGNGTLEVVAITKNFTTRTGNITLKYNITDDNGIIISGNYQGTFSMLNGF